MTGPMGNKSKRGKKKTLRVLPGGRRLTSTPAELAAMSTDDPEVAFYKSLFTFVRAAAEQDSKLDDMTVLRASMRFTASLAVTLAPKHGGDATQWANACETMYVEEELARKKGNDAG